MRLFKIVEAANEKDKLLTLKQFITSDDNPIFFVHFGAIDKVGINPRSKFNTPNGVYCYPLTKSIFEQLLNGELPFAQDQPYLHVISFKNKILNVKNYSLIDFDKDLNKLFVNNLIAEDIILIEKLKNTARVQTPFGKMWNITRIAANENPNRWNLILRTIGYDGVYDPGLSIIHVDEPTQCVILDTASVLRVKTMINPYASREILNHGGSKQDMDIVNKITPKNIGYFEASEEEYPILRFQNLKSKLKMSGKELLLNTDLMTSNFYDNDLITIIREEIDISDLSFITVLDIIYYNSYSEDLYYEFITNLINYVNDKDFKLIPISTLVNLIQELKLIDLYKIVVSADDQDNKIFKFILNRYIKMIENKRDKDFEERIFGKNYIGSIFKTYGKSPSDIAVSKYTISIIVNNIGKQEYVINNEEFFKFLGGPPGLSKEQKMKFINMTFAHQVK